MLVGYARTSTADQVAGFDAQVAQLEREGCERVFKEQVSSVAQRKQLEDAIAFCRAGDTFVVTKLDRLARNTRHLLDIADRLNSKGVALKILNIGLDTSTATGEMMLTMLAAIGQFERAIMLERQREGIAKAKADGKFKGRKPTAQLKRGEIEALAAQGLTKDAIAARLDIGVASVYRVLKQAKTTPPGQAQ